MEGAVIPGMTTTDFLKRQEETPLCGTFMVAGTASEIQTNSELIIAVANECFPPLRSDLALSPLRFRLWVDPKANSEPPWDLPYFRGLGNLVFGGFDSESSVIVDMRGRRIIGRFSPALACDQAYWKRVIFPRLITAIGPAIGVTELHCGCVARNGCGLVLFGAPGAGKSTLALALARQGFSLLSEDWTYFSRKDSDLVCWGLPSGVKLLPDAVRHFPELSRFKLKVTLNGEVAYQTQPERDFGVSLAQFCRPKWLVFLERLEEPAFYISNISAAQAEEQLCCHLLAQSPDVVVSQTAMVRQLVQEGCWVLRYGGNAQEIAPALREFCLGSQSHSQKNGAD
jgi:hypothetical protein